MSQQFPQFLTEVGTLPGLNREELGRLEGALPKEESTHLEAGQQGTTTKVHLLPDATHFTTKARWGTSLPGRLGTSPKDQELVN
jgi:hypothetical protein